jgi:hypothetical protein
MDGTEHDDRSGGLHPEREGQHEGNAKVSTQGGKNTDNETDYRSQEKPEDIHSAQSIREALDPHTVLSISGELRQFLKKRLWGASIWKRFQCVKKSSDFVKPI